MPIIDRIYCKIIIVKSELNGKNKFEASILIEALSIRMKVINDDLIYCQ